MPQSYRARPRRRRRHLFLKFLLLCALSVVFFRWSNHSLQTQAFTYASDRLPASFDGCVIVQLSDLHGAEFGENNQDLLQQVLDADPDYIFLTGDLQDQYRQTPQSYSIGLGRALAQIAPTYFVTGNHEWAFPDVRGLKRGLEEAGVTVLTNEYVWRGTGIPSFWRASTTPTASPIRRRRRSWRRKSTPWKGTPSGCFWPTGTTILKKNTAIWELTWSSPATATAG